MSVFIYYVFFAAQSGFSGVLQHHSSLGITDLGDALTDGNAQTGIPLLDMGGYINPVWLKFTVGSWKNAMQFDVTVSGQFFLLDSLEKSDCKIYHPNDQQFAVTVSTVDSLYPIDPLTANWRRCELMKSILNEEYSLSLVNARLIFMIMFKILRII